MSSSDRLENFYSNLAMEGRQLGILQAVALTLPGAVAGESTLWNSLASVLACRPQHVCRVGNTQEEHCTDRLKRIQLTKQHVLNPKYRKLFEDGKCDLVIGDMPHKDELGQDYLLFHAVQSGRVSSGEEVTMTNLQQVASRQVKSLSDCCTCILVVIRAADLLGMSRSESTQMIKIFEGLQSVNVPGESGFQLELLLKLVVTCVDEVIEDPDSGERLIKSVDELKVVEKLSEILQVAKVNLLMSPEQVTVIGFLNDSSINWADDSDPRVETLRALLLQMMQMATVPHLDYAVAKEDQKWLSALKNATLINDKTEHHEDPNSLNTTPS